MYAEPNEIDPKGIFTSLKQFHLLGDDVFLSSQAFNLGIIDNFITDLEYQVLRELEERERTPLSTHFLNAQSQMWIFAAYELLRTWRQRAQKMVEWANNGGLQLKLAVLKSKNDDYMHFGRENRIRQIESLLNDSNLVPQIKNQLLHLHIPLIHLEYIRVSIAKHEVRGDKKSIAMMSGYGRINSWCGSLDYDLLNGRDSIGHISRRDIADGIRSLDCSQAPPTDEMRNSFDEFMKEFQKGLQLPPVS